MFQEDIHNANALSHNYILPMFQAADKTIWIGTMGGGLNRLEYHPNPDSIKFKGITVNDGLPNNVIKGILEDDYGFLWISTNKGLTRYDVADNLFVNYDVSDGLQDNEFGELACCKLSDGEMLLRLVEFAPQLEEMRWPLGTRLKQRLDTLGVQHWNVSHSRKNPWPRQNVRRANASHSEFPGQGYLKWSRNLTLLRGDVQERTAEWRV